MNHKLLSSLTASLLVATLGVPPSSNANPTESVDPGLKASLKPLDSGDQIDLESQGDRLSDSGNSPNLTTSSSDPASSHTSSSKVAKVDRPLNEAVKVGEQKSPTALEKTGAVIAKIQPHDVAGRKAATLYVKNIPVLTFIGSTKAVSSGVKEGFQDQSSSNNSPASHTKSLNEADAVSTPSLASLLNSSRGLSELYLNQFNPSYLDAASTTDEPVWRATMIAAKINQLYRNGINAEKITVSWDDQPKLSRGTGDRFLIKADQTTIAVIDGNTLLPDSTRNLEKDALQTTNRLRRLLGDAAPLRSVTGKPGWRGQEISFGPIKFKLTGFASWYGPGFHGNPCASGEVFNQNAMTAAHRTLPFGTRVLVTNLDNGQSVVVRINDRGPYSGHRVIDLSTAAARILGLIQSGVAPVRLEIIDDRSASALGN